MKNTKFFIFSLILPLFACDITGDNTDVASEIKIAETVIYDFRQVKIEKGRPIYEVEGELGETFTKDQLMKITGVEFKQYDKEQVVTTEGTATSVNFKTDTENATLIGKMKFQSNTEGISLESEWLDWQNEEKILKGDTENPVRLKKDSGTILEGKGFRAYADTKTAYFDNGMTGVIIPETADSEEEAENEE